MLRAVERLAGEDFQSLHGNEVDAVDEGVPCRRGGRDERGPAGFDGPADEAAGRASAQGGDGGQGMEDVAHGADAHDEDARSGVVAWAEGMFSR